MQAWDFWNKETSEIGQGPEVTNALNKAFAGVRSWEQARQQRRV